jgi:3-phosphoshikimate 1-carboxyvinyltransferase
LPHDLIVMPQERPLSGSVPAPPDEDLSHLALLVAALADGESELRQLSKGGHVAALVDALFGLGVSFDGGANQGRAKVRGNGVRGLVDPGRPVSCDSSPLTLRRLAAVLVGHPFRTVLDVDPAMPLPGMPGVAAALRGRAAQIEGVFAGTRAGDVVAPFTVGPLRIDQALSGVEHELVAPGHDVKEALLLSGMYADEATYVREHFVSRDHLERLLDIVGVPIRVAGPIVALDPSAWDGKIEAFSFDIPGDVRAASLLSSAATLVSGSRVCVRGVGLNPTQSGAFALLRQMGGDVELTPQATRLGEAEGTVCASHAMLRAINMGGELLLGAAEHLPVLVALAARARGTTEIVGAAEAADAKFVDAVRAFGIETETVGGDGLVVVGRPEGPLEAVDIDAEGDPARATTAVILALVARGPSRIRHADALARRFPRVVGLLRALGADLRVERSG